MVGLQSLRVDDSVSDCLSVGHDVLRRFYTLFVYNWPCQQTDACLAHTYFLWALLEQHTKNVQAAREVYREAVGRCVMVSPPSSLCISLHLSPTESRLPWINSSP
jgi:hypothetical protein